MGPGKSTFASVRRTGTFFWKFRTQVQVCPPRTAPTSSSPTSPPRRAAPAWVWRSPREFARSTAADWKSKTLLHEEPCSGWCYRFRSDFHRCGLESGLSLFDVDLKTDGAATVLLDQLIPILAQLAGEALIGNGIGRLPALSARGKEVPENVPEVALVSIGGSRGGRRHFRRRGM